MRLESLTTLYKRLSEDFFQVIIKVFGKGNTFDSIWKKTRKNVILHVFRYHVLLQNNENKSIKPHIKEKVQCSSFIFVGGVNPIRLSTMEIQITKVTLLLLHICYIYGTIPLGPLKIIFHAFLDI